jgi:hypothetical protein
LAENQPCADSAQCAAGLTCFSPLDLEAGVPDPATKPLGSCQPYTAKGAVCAYGTDPDCEPGTLCIDGTCKGATGLFTAADGFKCFSTGSLCQQGLGCEFQGLPFLSEGKCTLDQGHSGCRLSLPDSCGKDAYCSSGYLNLPGTCSLLPTANEPCAKGAAQVFALAPACKTGLLCSQGSCLAPKRIGDACTFDDQCLSTNCKPDDPDAGASDAGVPGHCAPLSC